MDFPWGCWFSRRHINRLREKHGRICYKAAGKNGSAAAPGSSFGDTGCYVVSAALCILDLQYFCRYRCHDLPGGRAAGNCGLAGSPADGRDKFLLLLHPLCGRVAHSLAHKRQPWLT